MVENVPLIIASEMSGEFLSALVSEYIPILRVIDGDEK